MPDIPINEISTISVHFNLIPTCTDRYMIQSPLMFSDGDHLTMYLEKFKLADKTVFRITDYGAMGVRHGDTVFKQGKFLAFNGLYMDHGMLCIDVNIDEPDDVVRKIVKYAATLIAIDDYFNLMPPPH